MTLKEKLLILGIVEDNEYLDKYCEIIENNRETKKEKFKTQSHHIIPRSYYKHCSLPIDNSKENIVNLTHSDHLLAHYYLNKCASVDWFKSLCLNSLIKMHRDFTNQDSTNYWKDYTALPGIETYNELVEEALKLRSKLYTGRIHINNGVVTTIIDKDKLDIYLEAGWQLGRIYQMNEETKEKIASKLRGTHHEVSEETRKKIGEANKISLKGKKLSKERVEKIRKRSSNCKWYNNGVENKFIPKDKVPPEGYQPGMILTNITKDEWITKVHAGRKPEDYNTTGGTIVINDGKVNKHIKKEELNDYLKEGWKNGKLPLGKLNWYNNGIKNTRAYECPEGYVLGRLITEETRKRFGDGMRGKHITEETKRKISNKLKKTNI